VTGRLIEGMAKCICNEGMERVLARGEVVYIKEIPNMRGHCFVIRDKRLPLVGYHLERFELLKEDSAESKTLPQLRNRALKSSKREGLTWPRSKRSTTRRSG